MKIFSAAEFMTLGSTLRLIRMKDNSKLIAFFHGGRKQARKKRGWFESKESDEEKLKVLKPGDCKEDVPLLQPKCKTAMVVGGSKDVGFSAADYLLCHGAKNVILLDEATSAGQTAVQKLCDKYGKDRADFGLCALSSACKFEAVFDSVRCKHKNIHIIFNNLDGSEPQRCTEYREDDNDEWSKTRRAIEVGVKYMGKQNGGQGGIIINAGRILGFMGWPEEPVPVYCTKEPVIETTQDFAKIYPFDKTGVRIIALLKAARNFEEIGLPDFPAANSKPECFVVSPELCTSVIGSKIGRAIIHVMARGKNGSTWLVEPAVSAREIPRLLHFPEKGKKIDPKIYDETSCIPTIKTFCASAVTSKSSSNIRKDCTTQETKK